MSDLLNKLVTQFEPKKKNRFIMRFPEELGIHEFVLASASRPTITINEVEVPFLNTSVYIAGRFTWESIDITLRDGIGPSTTQAVMEWIRLCAESASGRMGYAVGYKKLIELEMIDPSGVVVEKWLLEGGWLSTANFGDLSMDDDNIAEVQINLRFDRALLLF